MSDSFKLRRDVCLMSAALFPTLIRREVCELQEAAGWLLPADLKIRFITCTHSEHDLRFSQDVLGISFFLCFSSRGDLWEREWALLIGLFYKISAVVV